MFEIQEIVLALIALTSGIGGSVVGYLGLRRRSSGQIATTDAETLWTEARDIRKEYKELADTLRVEVRQAQKQAAGLSLESAELRKALHAAEEHGRQCDENNRALQIELNDLRSRIVEAAQKPTL